MVRLRSKKSAAIRQDAQRVTGRSTYRHMNCLRLRYLAFIGWVFSLSFFARLARAIFYQPWARHDIYFS